MDKQSVNKVLDEQIRPRLAMDGGGIELVDIKDNKVYVKLQGACGCCPGAQMTLKMGVERALKQEFPELEEVIAV
jgi:Fe-S cluster biogenesis protein NfuA